MRILTEKLSAALSNISAKEELVKQHAKVAEEAVSGKHANFIRQSLFSCKGNYNSMHTDFVMMKKKRV